MAAGATTLSASQRVRLAPSEPVWARYISRDMEETMPPAPATGSPPPERDRPIGDEQRLLEEVLARHVEAAVGHHDKRVVLHRRDEMPGEVLGAA